jgi:hypothetical protein
MHSKGCPVDLRRRPRRPDDDRLAQGAAGASKHYRRRRYNPGIGPSSALPDAAWTPRASTKTHGTPLRRIVAQRGSGRFAFEHAEAADAGRKDTT